MLLKRKVAKNSYKNFTCGKKVISKKKIYVLAVQLGLLVILLHLIRNVTELYFLIFLIILFSFGVFALKSYKKNSFLIPCAILVVAFIYVFSVSFIAGQQDSFAVGLVRLFYLAPIVLFFFSANIDDAESSSIWKVIFYFLIAASISIPLQYAIGPVSWFADASERAGTYRFASLAGSLTVFGGVVGVAVVLLYYLHKGSFIKIPYLVVILLASALSLQKMTIGTLLLAFVILYFGINRFSRTSQKKYFLIVLIYILGLVALYWVLSYNFPNHIKFLSVIFTEDAGLAGDVSFMISVWSRLSELPLVAFNFWGSTALFFGVGVYGGAGGLGYPELPMSHNQFADIVLIFGVPIGILIIGVMIKYACISVVGIIKSNNPRYVTSCSIYLILVISTTFSGGLFFQPVIGLIFWFSFSEIYRIKQYEKLSR